MMMKMKIKTADAIRALYQLAYYNKGENIEHDDLYNAMNTLTKYINDTRADANVKFNVDDHLIDTDDRNVMSELSAYH